MLFFPSFILNVFSDLLSNINTAYRTSLYRDHGFKYGLDMMRHISLSYFFTIENINMLHWTYRDTFLPTYVGHQQPHQAGLTNELCSILD